ncbi:MAG: electron transfer flavoprotein subunit beta/FixA family protein [Gemmatimonadota bacterium]
MVCIKRVPDTESKIRIAADSKTIDGTGIKFVMSPYDEFAVEAALRLKEAAGEGEVIAVSVGDGVSAEQLRTGLAMGADRAVLLEGEPTMDGLATARALAAEIGGMDADLVLLGMKATDDDQQQVGAMLAEILDRPCITVASGLEAGGAGVVARREIEGGVETVEAPLPAVVTITKGDFEPRYPSLKGIMAAKRKPLEQKPAELGVSRVRVLELSYPPERPPGKMVGEGPDAVPELVRLLKDEAKVL